MGARHLTSLLAVLTPLAVMVVTAGCTGNEEGALTEEGMLHQQRIAAVESGLIEIDSPFALFDPAHVFADMLDTFTLADRMAELKVPGVSVAVIDGGELAWAKGYGVLSADGDTPVTTESLFEAASTSKLLTGIMTLHYVEQGAFDLDTDVNEYLTSWKVPENEFTRDRKVTLRLLLTHRAGLPSTNFADDRPDRAWTLADILNGVPGVGNDPATPVRPLEDEWVYSNLGCIVIQLILEDTFGRPFPELARDVIFEPLGMDSSTFQYPLPPELAERETMPHDAEGTACAPLMDHVAFGHAGLMATPSDMARLYIELMRSYNGESGVLLSPEMTRRMFTKQFAIEPSPIGAPVSEGLGVFLRGEGEGLMFFHHGGNTPGANSLPVGLPNAGKGAIIMTNGHNGEMLFMELLASIMREYEWSL